MALVKDGKADFICRTIKRVEGPQQRDFTVRPGSRQLRFVAKDRCGRHCQWMENY